MKKSKRYLTKEIRLKIINSFVNETQYRNRFFFSSETNQFLEKIKNYTNIDRTIQIGTTFYRARLGHQIVEPLDFLSESDVEKLDSDDYLLDEKNNIITLDKSEMMPPPAEKIEKGGRMNPNYISYTYLSECIHGACVEVRPFINGTISVATIRSKSELKIKDFTTWDNIPNNFEKLILRELDLLLSFPISQDESSLEYLPTQIIAEYLRFSGYDGICYNSSLMRNVKNYVIFDHNKLEWISGDKVLVLNEVQYTFNEIQSAGHTY